MTLLLNVEQSFMIVLDVRAYAVYKQIMRLVVQTYMPINDPIYHK